MALVREAFLFSETRTVTKTATVSLFSNHYEVDQALVGRRVELVFDPFDLEQITVRYMDTDFGLAVPQKIGRHVHPMAKQAPEAGGADRHRLPRDRRGRHREATGSPIGYSDLAPTRAGSRAKARADEHRTGAHRTSAFRRCPSARTSRPPRCTAISGHQEAVARIAFLVAEQAIGVVTGEVGSGKTVAARAAMAELEAVPAHPHLPAEPGDRRPGDLRGDRRAPRWRAPLLQVRASSPRRPSCSPPRRPNGDGGSVVVCDEAHLLDPDPARGAAAAHQRRDGLRVTVRARAPRPAEPSVTAPPRELRRARPARHAPLRDPADEPRGDRELRRPPPQARWSLRHALLRRRAVDDPSSRPGPSPGGEQPRPIRPSSRPTRTAAPSSTRRPPARPSPRSTRSEDGDNARTAVCHARRRRRQRDHRT